MTIKQRQYCRDVSEQKKIVVFEPRKEWISEETRQLEYGRACPSEETLVFEEKSTEGSNNQLLILANFAELMLESDYNIPPVHRNPQNYVIDSSMEAQHLQENVDSTMATTDSGTTLVVNWGKADELPLMSRERIERDGSGGGRVTRLNHIRRQARLKFVDKLGLEAMCPCKTITQDVHMASC
ncbi:hypothetical protein V6N13_055586 [Hibiscus sabdariffa]|uniref:Uncharacterized protein n=2 Tax=Hibiscus sabdariffa TaxID=183260 RepID=A0ABR2NTY7_9ROSI